ncbi:MAG: hypothetical protein K5921_11440 [Lachnospiraceae bacterium]|nr:hypothetical protein [Lachnospiraceae bacterium]
MKVEIEKLIRQIIERVIVFFAYQKSRLTGIPSKNERDEIKIWAHRGLSYDYPENTIEAFTEAAKLNGLTGIEFDVQRTGDGKLVVFHDETVNDRVAEIERGRRVYIKDITCDKLQAYKLKINRLRKYRGSPLIIPTLEDVFKALKPYCEKKGLKLNIELKTSVVRYEGIERETCDMVKKYGLGKYIIYSSFLPDTIRLIKEIEPLAQTGMLQNTLSDCIKKGDSAGADAYHPWAGALNIKRMKIGNRPIRAFGLGEPMYSEKRLISRRDMRNLCSLGVTDIITNVADRYLDEGKGSHRHL